MYSKLTVKFVLNARTVNLDEGVVFVVSNVLLSSDIYKRVIRKLNFDQKNSL